MNRKNTIKKISAAAIAAVTLALPFTSVCADDGTNSALRASEEQAVRSQIPLPDFNALQTNAPSVNITAPAAPARRNQTRPRRFVPGHITAGDRQFQAFSRAVRNAIIADDQRAIDMLSARMRVNQIRRLQDALNQTVRNYNSNSAGKNNFRYRKNLNK